MKLGVGWGRVGVGEELVRFRKHMSKEVGLLVVWLTMAVVGVFEGEEIWAISCGALWGRARVGEEVKQFQWVEAELEEERSLSGVRVVKEG